MNKIIALKDNLAEDVKEIAELMLADEMVIWLQIVENNKDDLKHEQINVERYNGELTYWAYQIFQWTMSKLEVEELLKEYWEE